MDINHLAALLGAIAAFVFGGLWYGPLFGKAWQRESGATEPSSGGQTARIFAIAFVANLIAAEIFALFLGPKPALGFAVGAGFSAGLCWVAMALATNYAFAQRSFKLWLIDGGWSTLQFALYGLILGLWH